MFSKFFVLFFVCCASQCSLNFQYYQVNSGSCQACNYNCISCFNATICITCAPQYYLLNSTCYPCRYGCAICSGPQQCTTCNQGLYIDGKGQCYACNKGVQLCTISTVERCKAQYFMLGSICVGCLDHCTECSDFSSCNQCSSGYYLNANQCQNCSNNCLSCTNNQSCTSCQRGYKIQTGNCVAQNCSSLPFCVRCFGSTCLQCSKGKYISSGTCQQGGSLLCQQSKGKSFIHCETSRYGCTPYSIIQTDSSGTRLDVCLPRHATPLTQYIYGKQDQNCTSCQTPNTYTLNFNSEKAYYSLKYYFMVKVYTQNKHTITVSLNTSIFTHNIDVTEQMQYNNHEPTCPSCKYAQLYLEAQLDVPKLSIQNQIKISNMNSKINLVEYVIELAICQVLKCSKCSGTSDCLQCQAPYILQINKCVEICDAGFYRFGQTCVLKCPSSTYPIQSQYICSACLSPCQTCSSALLCLSCIDGYFLQSNLCVANCSSNQYFGNSTSRQCEQCPNPCASCILTNLSVQCLSCSVGYLMADQSCTFICLDGTYPTVTDNITQCLPCNQSCKKCFLNGNTCSSCSTGYLLQENTCIAATNGCKQLHYLASQINSCKLCHYPCAQCIENKLCTSCLKGSLYNNSCVILCPIGYFMNLTLSNNVTCSSCVAPCLTCSNYDNCLSCINGTFLYNGQCNSNCTNLKYFANILNNQCTSCIGPCKTCLSSKECLSCSTGYLDGMKCTLNCNSSSYIHANFSCTLCTLPCQKCYSPSQCIQCQLPYVLDQQSCIQEINCTSLNKFILYSGSTGQCKECVYPCQSCNQSAVLCLSCVSTLMFINDTQSCASQCPTSYYRSGSNSCNRCSQNCLNCTNFNQCTSCSVGMYLNNTECLKQCPARYYGNNLHNTCQVCSTPCLQCHSINLCKSCSRGYLSNNLCLDVCPDGTIANTSNSVCQRCSNNCRSCAYQVLNCTACRQGLFLRNFECVTECGVQQYANTITSQCDQCVTPCANCTSAVTCLSCQTSFYFHLTRCFSDCPNGYYQNNTLSTCVKCLEYCATCNKNASECITCANMYYKFNGTCVSTCPTDNYISFQTKSCHQCIYPCLSCSGIGFCNSCSGTLKLFQNYCFVNCPIHYYSENNFCLACPSSCLQCTSPDNCQQCAASYLLDNQSCVANCPPSKYANRQQLTNYALCTICDSSCLTCQSIFNCTQCTLNNVHFNGFCRSQCPPQSYNDSSRTCLPCPTYCNQCLNNSYCTDCTISSFIYQNICYLQCPALTFSLSNQTCTNCISPCRQCQSQFVCIDCLDGFIYFHSYCVLECPFGVWYYPNNRTCNDLCPYIKQQSTFYCYLQHCGEHLVHFQGYCIEQCPNNMFVNLNQQCQQCSQICNKLFIADFSVLKTDVLSLNLYFSQRAEIASLSALKVTFYTVDEEPFVMNQTYTETNQYSLRLSYSTSELFFNKVILTIPYIKSKETNQFISRNSYSTSIDSYYQFSQSSPIISYLPLCLTIIVVICMMVNCIVHPSHFLQILDFIQLIGATLYLQIQYPEFLNNFLHSLSPIMLTFWPTFTQVLPYTFSPSKFIIHHTDTSIIRSHLINLIIFLITLAAMVIILLYNFFYPQKLTKAVNRIRYRHLNDLFSIFVFPLLIFGLHFKGNLIDIFLTVVLLSVSVAFISILTYKIVTVEEKSQLHGLLGNLESGMSVLALMYVPFSYFRKIIIALTLALQPNKPIATLTLFLTFTILIMVCLIFYQPFQNQVTDYIAIYTQSSLILYIVLVILLGLNVLGKDQQTIVGVIAVIVLVVCVVIGLMWLIYLLVQAIKEQWSSQEQNKERSEPMDEAPQQENTSHAMIHRSEFKEEYQKGLNHKYKQEFKHEQHLTENLNHLDIVSNQVLEQFKHYGDSEQSQSIENQYRLPQLLMKINNDASKQQQ